MKGLAVIPSSDDLRRAYEELIVLSANRPLSSARLVELAHWSRLDPRLAELLTQHLARHWSQLPLGELRAHLKQSVWPATLAVLATHAAQDPGLERSERRALRAWTLALMSGIEAGDGGQFFIGTRAFAGAQMRKDAELSSRLYLKWGYLGRDLLLNKAARRPRTLAPPQSRRRVLDELIRLHRRTGQRLTVADYRQALDHMVSPRQAELDLKSHPKLIARGRTRGRFYVVRR